GPGGGGRRCKGFSLVPGWVRPARTVWRRRRLGGRDATGGFSRPHEPRHATDTSCHRRAPVATRLRPLVKSRREALLPVDPVGQHRLGGWESAEDRVVARPARQGGGEILATCRRLVCGGLRLFGNHAKGG